MMWQKKSKVKQSRCLEYVIPPCWRCPDWHLLFLEPEALRGAAWHTGGGVSHRLESRLVLFLAGAAGGRHLCGLAHGACGRHDLQLDRHLTEVSGS